MGSIFLAMNSNTNAGREICKMLFCRELAVGVENLFQYPNPYLQHNINPKHYGEFNYFVVEKGQRGFEELKHFILKHYYKNKIDYNVKAIVQYQFSHSGDDASNPLFHNRIIGFIPETEYFNDIRFTEAPDAIMCGVKCMPKTNEDNKGFKWITTQEVLTKELDAFFTDKIVSIANWFILIATALSIFIWWIDKKA
jgi:hypothetical protein